MFSKLEPELPKTPQQYDHLIQEALYEVSDLRTVLQYETEDADGMEEAWKFIDRLEHELKNLSSEVVEGRHAYGGHDLPYMEYVAKQRLHVLPFRGLLKEINRVHRLGLAENAD